MDSSTKFGLRNRSATVINVVQLPTFESCLPSTQIASQTAPSTTYSTGMINYFGDTSAVSTVGTFDTVTDDHNHNHDDLYNQYDCSFDYGIPSSKITTSISISKAIPDMNMPMTISISDAPLSRLQYDTDNSVAQYQSNSHRKPTSVFPYETQ